MPNTVFDPFGDFNTKGYLRNIRHDKNPSDIKHFEHNLFRANLDFALAHLASAQDLTYQDFLTVHRILFSDYYPWAGQDRAAILPDSAVKKGNVLFSHPLDAKRAIEHGLRLGQHASTMLKKPGEIMGLFAYGHPFLDGNGRTMLLVHLELCHRAGFSISWQHTHKQHYLEKLSQEIATPGTGILDAYLLQFQSAVIPRGQWGNDILLMKGLDGLDEATQVDGCLSDTTVAEKYKKFEEKRQYTYTTIPDSSAKNIL